VGHTGREPVERPFPVGCTTPVLGGLCINKTTTDPVRLHIQLSEMLHQQAVDEDVTPADPSQEDQIKTMFENERNRNLT
jgi:hypothetical protein